MTTSARIKIQIYDQEGNRYKSQGDDVIQQLAHAKAIYYQKFERGRN
jgi:hypothetical protein